MKLVSIFTAHWERFVEGSQAMLTAAHYRAARAVQWCRTAALGGQLHECQDCDKQKFAWHSCNHRSCLQCGAQDQQEWAAAQKAKLLRAPCFMITVTLPEELRRFVYKEQEWFYGLFFAAVSGALKDLGQDPKHLGGSIGMTAVLHTWTREMLYHPHLHVIMPGVAINQDGHRIQRAKGRRYLFPKAVLNVVFRNRIKSAAQEGNAAVPPATPNTTDAGEKTSSSVPPCPCCGKTMELVRRIKPLDLWIRTPLTPPPAATGWTPGKARPPNPGSPPDQPCS